MYQVYKATISSLTLELRLANFTPIFGALAYFLYLEINEWVVFYP
ncbi:hypothetical protein SPWS13_1342 [Shewanella putrefaciens]|nr:hypothetical protein SPWS13_1342 [Shewanella putrefaciens]